MKSLASVNDRRVFANPQSLRRNIRRLRRVDQAIARSKKVHGKANPSNRRRKLYDRRRALHERINDSRRNNHRQGASAIAKSARVVMIETLKVKGMLKNRRLARALADAGMSAFLRELGWQWAKRGVVVLHAPANFPSTPAMRPVRQPAGQGFIAEGSNLRMSIL